MDVPVRELVDLFVEPYVRPVVLVPVFVPLPEIAVLLPEPVPEVVLVGRVAFVVPPVISEVLVPLELIIVSPLLSPDTGPVASLEL